MKLEYVYDNNNNLKYTLKAITITGLSIILLFTLMIMLNNDNIDYSMYFASVCAFIVITIICNIIALFIIIPFNKYKRNQYDYIKNNGFYYEGELIMAKYYIKRAINGKLNALLKSSGEIVVSANNKTYTIIDINYNKDFKILEKKLNNNFYENREKIINKSHKFKETGIFERINCKNIKIGIYVLDNKVIADLNSIKVS